MAFISVCLQVAAVQWIFLILEINTLTLMSSVEPVEGQVTVCPDMTLTFTCSDTEVPGILWYARPLLNEDNTPGIALGSDIGVPIVVADVFTITLVEAEHTVGILANLTSTLTVLVNDMIQNGTNVTCITPALASFLLFKQGPPLPPSNVTVQKIDYQVENFTFLLSWDGQEGDTYTVNTSTPSIQVRDVPLIAEYNIPLQITISSMNCARESEQVTTTVSVAGCSPPTPPVNGSVSDFTSSRVGAQVTYSCDTDLVLVGERVATCSEVSLQWLPSSEDIMCVQPPDQNNHSLSSNNNSLSTSVKLAITAVVCGVCSFTAGLVLGVLMTQCSVCCYETKTKKAQTAGPVDEVEAILPQKGAGIELKTNEAYEYVSH